MMEAFIKENTAFWSRYINKSNGYVLVEQSYHPVIMMCNASFAAIVSAARNLKPLFILDSSCDNAIKRVLESYYPECAFVYTDSRRYMIPRKLAYFQAIKVFLSLKVPGDILKLHDNGIKYGDLIYDGVLYDGYATISELDWKVLKAIHAFFWHKYFVRDLVKRYDIKAAVYSHIVGLKDGTIVRNLLQQNIEVFNRTGSYQTQVKKYRNLRDAGDYCIKPEQKYFSLLMAQKDDTIIQLAEKYLKERFNHEIRDIASDAAFDENKRTFTDKQEFCEYYNLDPAKKIVFVMLHAFNDQPHSHFGKPMLFQDYYDWFVNTLEVAKTVDSVNWVFKEHPVADLYPTKDLSLDTVFNEVSQENIRFIGRHANLNSRTLQYIADTIVTCMGTAGLEYACHGIPCLLAGSSLYSGFGFTIEPKSILAYKLRLKNISEVPRLNEEQIKAAKVVVYFQQSMMQGAPYPFSPYYEDYNKIRYITLQELARDTLKLMKNRKELDRKVRIIESFINNPTFTQYINLEKYDFMREAI